MTLQQTDWRHIIKTCARCPTLQLHRSRKKSSMSEFEQTRPKKNSNKFPFVDSILFQNPTLLAVSLSVFAAYTGIGMVVPVRVLYAESRGASLAIISAMASSYLISNFLFQYPSGWLADRWGRKPMMIISLFAQATLSAVYLLISDQIGR